MDPHPPAKGPPVGAAPPPLGGYDEGVTVKGAGGVPPPARSFGMKQPPTRTATNFPVKYYDGTYKPVVVAPVASVTQTHTPIIPTTSPTTGPAIVNVKVPAGSKRVMESEKRVIEKAYMPTPVNIEEDDFPPRGGASIPPSGSQATSPRFLSNRTTVPPRSPQQGSTRTEELLDLNTFGASQSPSHSASRRSAVNTVGTYQEREDEFLRSGSLYRDPSGRRSQTRQSTSQSPRMSGGGRFDSYDRAPEDRIPEERYGYGDDLIHPFGRGDCVVRGSFVIEGCNFARFEASSKRPDERRMFTTAIRDDMVACVGQGVRRHDIMLRAAPGPIRGVVLEYDGRREMSPSLVDADWGIEFEYAIRVRSEATQKNVGLSLYTALTDANGLDLQESRHAWVRFIDQRANPADIYTLTTHDARSQAQ